MTRISMVQRTRIVCLLAVIASLNAWSPLLAPSKTNNHAIIGHHHELRMLVQQQQASPSSPSRSGFCSNAFAASGRALAGTCTSLSAGNADVNNDVGPSSKRRFAQPNSKHKHMKRNNDNDSNNDKDNNNNNNNNNNRNRHRRDGLSGFRGDGRLAELNAQRVKTAGRIGTKRYVDPCKVFIGNLPYDVDDDELYSFVLEQTGQSRVVVSSAKVIKEWKTGKSKGYGFCMFVDPMYATVCIETVNGRMLKGRAVSVSQGKKKDDENQLYIDKQRRKQQQRERDREAEDDEDSAIASGLEEAESDVEYEYSVGDDDEGGDVRTFGGGGSGGSDEDDFELDARLFGMAADDEDDDDIDGVYLERHFKYEEVDGNLNREQRREAQRKMKRKKKPSKGFGVTDS
eukprot:CAMPEP_0119550326 /NCGR_PEP_ID=MMETSP1352-20130426/3857_1 /TAXON_ID=265584 /ORGANISM="Stauroneis constricta, Strain CCMP1120" /LENGTH=399 /DNA_ID=CAMNT_0007596135 /DNA_START=59 /DNA_END=1258 /DNA_ORIENTATION=-